MPIVKDAVPASFRKPVESSRFTASLMSPNLISRVRAAAVISGAEARAMSVNKSGFARMPEEPEDARITGVTRSLNRRLLALNVSGSRRIADPALSMGKIA